MRLLPIVPHSPLAQTPGQKAVRRICRVQKPGTIGTKKRASG
jgi:hypothetical protein